MPILHRVYGASITWTRNARGRRHVSSLRLRNFLTLFAFLFFSISEGDFLSTKNYPLQLAELEFGFFPTSFLAFPITSTAERSLRGRPRRQTSGNRAWLHSASCFALREKRILKLFDLLGSWFPWELRETCLGKLNFWGNICLLDTKLEDPVQHGEEQAFCGSFYEQPSRSVHGGANAEKCTVWELWGESGESRAAGGCRFFQVKYNLMVGY